MSESESYNDGYEEVGFQLPGYLASVYESHAGDFVILDSITGKLLTKEYVIIFVDSARGFFVEEKRTTKGIEYVAHKNPNMQIIKDENFYDLDEEED